jgi:DNA-binding MarR family transcriptional regulator
MFPSLLDALLHLDRMERLANIGPLTRRAATAFLLTERAGGIHSSSKIMTTMQISPPALCRALDNLGSNGLTQRERNDDDRRCNFIHLTDKGLDFADRLRGK